MSITQPKANTFLIGLFRRYIENSDTFKVGPIEIETYKNIKTLITPEEYFTPSDI